MKKSLRRIRAGVAIVVFLLLTFYFLDFAGLAPSWFGWLPKVQFVPTLLAHSLVIVTAIILVTLLFGRIYCSVLCPMGIMQDIFGRLSQWTAKRRKKRKFFGYKKARPVLRWSVLAGFVVALAAGFTMLAGIVEPYSAYGRIASSIFEPVYRAVNNLLASVFTSMNVYTFYKVEVAVYSWFTFTVALATLLVVGYMAWRSGRLYCNTVCPVGTFLGFISKYSLFKVRMDDTDCNNCGLCGMNCKSSCIDAKNDTIDYSRCVACFNCLDSCPKGGMTFEARFGSRRKKGSVLPAGKDSPAKTDMRTGAADEAKDPSRRRFIAALAAATVAVPAVAARRRVGSAVEEVTGLKDFRTEYPLSPPGSISHRHLHRHCTACHLCVSKCPQNILKPAATQYGIHGLMQPRMDFSRGFCNYDCTVCSNVCPNGAIKPLTTAQKHLVQVGHVVFIRENCIVYRFEQSCGACSEHCPTQAISMVPYKDGLTIPETNRDLCIGCGGCEFICPAKPFLAVKIEGNPVHLEAEPVPQGKEQKAEIDDFGF